ncbi:hypothetical protein MC7420_7658 [Coleofasciculus chthonoplastes PCC 7420]|uniref:Uncharacterized protein n=1 Tax=Coleofasciculus chthonoplastes PCC 7420 TaxID=118168 RepID=B4VJ17_9CYAN|nr:hypothetical protein MC7420_7658 [Coleofasciculus chthonoplastes PCC 7420]
MLARFYTVSIYSSTFPPHPLTPSPTVGRRGIGCSCSPLPGVGEGLGVRG